ncbi:DNA (cytosine-5-)-methyltransferase [Corynebacterium sp. sy017]|uniref:DNA (cytosine-5-)-methyltransferase n=1 Tax=unclassified Corynebacterium TaxID=2624378 RepID=UPI00118600C7|nr:MULTISPECIES: DNA (cytosine-5-)-methyltransferase [unclassified Corynebacterium]MBP3088512.1 DNA (cytosine-5-)-methyltransferase [Corynebacterium sp. sy017]TSD91817.1 DNA (cytosine-5-)-methyltransferase [Corynebacterium sp. SY003]
MTNTTLLPDTEHYLSISEVSSQLSVSIDTLRRWEKKGLIKGQRNANNHRVFKVQEVQRLMSKINGSSTENNYKILRASSSEFSSIDLFAGAGGTALGLSHAGFQHLLVNEMDKHAVATLKENKPEWNILHDDVHNVSFHNYKGKVDLLEGGFPCQAFSYAGQKKGFADTRGTLFHEFARAVSECKPRIAVGENVRGLVTHDKGRTLKVMLKTLQDIGYTVAWKVLRAQYLDVPQKRERLIIIAVRNDCDYPILFPQEKDYTISLAEAIGDAPQSEGAHYADWKYDVMKQVPPGGYWRDLPDAVQREYMKASYFHSGGKTGMARRLSWDEPSLTLTCNPAQKQTERCHPEHTRPLNVREYARIQTFPDEWVFKGGMTQAYKQIGNAVPVNMAFHIGMGIRAMLEGTVPEGYEIATPEKPIEQEITEQQADQLGKQTLLEV